MMKYPFIRFPALKVLSLAEVVRVWDTVSEYMLQQIALNKGVAIDGLGVFYVLRQHYSKLNGDVLAPKFHLLEGVMQAQRISHANRDVPDDLQVVPLDYSQLSLKTTVSEKMVEECVNDLVVLFTWGAGLGEDYDLVFKGIGILRSRDNILRMTYYKDFLLAIDGTGTVLNCMLSNPLTRINVISDNDSSAFHMSPQGIRVLPMFEIKLPPGRTAEDFFLMKGSGNKQVVGTPGSRCQHPQMRHSPGKLTRARKAKGEKESTKSEEFHQLLPTWKFQLEQQEDMVEEREKGSHPEDSVPPGRKFSVRTLPVLKPEEKVEARFEVKPPERSELSQVPPLTPRPPAMSPGKPDEQGRGSHPEKSVRNGRKHSIRTLRTQKPEEKVEARFEVKTPERSELSQVPPLTPRPPEMSPGKPDEQGRGSHPEKSLHPGRKISSRTSRDRRAEEEKGVSGLTGKPPERSELLWMPHLTPRPPKMPPGKPDEQGRGSHPEKNLHPGRKFSSRTSRDRRAEEEKGVSGLTGKPPERSELLWMPHLTPRPPKMPPGKPDEHGRGCLSEKIFVNQGRFWPKISNQFEMDLWKGVYKPADSVALQIVGKSLLKGRTPSQPPPPGGAHAQGKSTCAQSRPRLRHCSMDTCGLPGGVCHTSPGLRWSKGRVSRRKQVYVPVKISVQLHTALLAIQQVGKSRRKGWKPEHLWFLGCISSSRGGVVPSCTAFFSPASSRGQDAPPELCEKVPGAASAWRSQESHQPLQN
ncbi:uncharacterized protein LOC128850761 isoform X3 [Cuculus canorus]|uniref:uncharacterized protein LOC128850761 isoform X3 n=1 Tax=Cuculus canorus TaxID=55661 RepID=UPI0023AA5330|nr:uncharacterized protein LOC128850761 isoform X3 [Cuculus canorus]